MEIEAQTKTKNILIKRGITTYKDVLDLLPKRYKDYREVHEELDESLSGKDTCIIGIVESTTKKNNGKQSIITSKIVVGSRRMSITYIGASQLYPKLTALKGVKVAIFGNLEYNAEFNWFSMLSPDGIIPVDQDYSKFCKIKPVYKKFEGISEKTMNQIRVDAIKSLISERFNEIPADLAQKYGQGRCDIRRFFVSL